MTPRVSGFLALREPPAILLRRLSGTSSSSSELSSSSLLSLLLSRAPSSLLPVTRFHTLCTPSTPCRSKSLGRELNVGKLLAIGAGCELGRSVGRAGNESLPTEASECEASECSDWAEWAEWSEPASKFVSESEPASERASSPESYPFSSVSETNGGGLGLYACVAGTWLGCVMNSGVSGSPRVWRRSGDDCVAGTGMDCDASTEDEGEWERDSGGDGSGGGSA